MAFFEVSGLSASYDLGRVKALRGVSFGLEKGKSIGIAGESACGKSTLGLAIMRMLRGGAVTSGSIIMDGHNILDMDGSEFDAQIRWKKISMIFQGAMSSLDPVFTIRAQLDELVAVHGAGAQSIEDAVTSVGLEKSVLEKYAHELSGGMKQRIAISMALLLGPRLIIADEPTTALDVLVQAQIIHLLKKLKRNGVSLIIITHDLAVLSELADTIGIMYAGQMVELGEARQIYESPRHPYTRALLESVPTINGAKPSYIPGLPPNLALPVRGCGFAARCPDEFARCEKDPPELGSDSGYCRCWLYE